MPEASTSDPESEPPATSVTSISGGVNLDAQRDVTIGGDVVGRDKIVATYGYTVEQVSTLLTQISSTFQPKPFDGRCPYLGLDAFSEDDADRFFGRETLVGELVARVKESRFVVIAGPSGSGKSSLVRAGLIHALKQGALPNSDRWLYANLTPGRDPIESLALAMSRMAKSPDCGKYVRDHSAEPGALHEIVESQLSDRKDQRAVIFVDQFEEVFTQVSKEDERAAFLNLLTHAATLENGRVTVLFTLRSDFASNCATYPQLNALLNQQFMQVGAMQPDELVSAIARPALQVGLRIDPDLIAQIVNDMQDGPGALPLMQFALKDLFDSQRAKGGVIALTLNDYLARGGLRKALERHADAAFAILSENEQQLARTIFSRLIEIGRGVQDTRRTAVFEELVPTSEDALQVKAVVQKLADARLITTNERDYRETVTIAHEMLIEAWPWLRKLVNENREAIALQNQLAEDAQEWKKHQRDASYLYSGARLATAREQLVKRKMVSNELAQKFIGASIEAFEYARRRRRRITQSVISGLIIISLVFAGLSLWAVGSQQSAIAAQKVSRSRELATIALSQIDKDPERGLLIAIEAEKAADTFDAQDALRQLLLASRIRVVLSPQETKAWVAGLSLDGKQIVTGGVDGATRVWDTKTGQELRVLLGHKRLVNSVQFSPDGKQIITASDDKTARVWDAVTGQAVIILRGHEERVYDAQFSPDGKQIVTASDDKTARVWDAATGQQRAVLRGHEGSITSVQFSPDGKQIVTASDDKTARVWDAATGQQRAVLRGHEGSITSVQFSPDGKQIVTASDDKTARVWDAATGQQRAVLRGHEGSVTSAQFSSDNKQIITAGRDRTARIWDAVTGQALAVLRGHDGWVMSAHFSPDGKQIITASAFRSATLIWDVFRLLTMGNATAEGLIVLPGLNDGVYDAQFSLDSKHIFTISLDGTIRIWSSAGEESTILRGHRDAIRNVHFSPNGTQIVTAGDDGTMRVWDETTGQVVSIMHGHESWVYDARFSPNGKQVATAGLDKTARVWDAATGQEMMVLRGHENAVVTAKFSPDGKQIVTASDDKTARVWDAVTGEEVIVLRGHTGELTNVQFSPDGKKIVTASWDGTARVWDAATGLTLAVLLGHDGAVLSTQFSPDGLEIVTANMDGTTGVWDMKTGQALRVLRGHESRVFSAQFSPDGKQIITASEDQTARVWDVATGQAVAVLRGHNGWVFSAQFSPDGKQIVTASSDGTARIWSSATGQELAVLRGHDGEVITAEFSPNGKEIVTASADGMARVFVVQIEDVIALANSRVTRDLTCEERVQYLHEDRVCPTPTPVP